ncbi:E3 ubiquitin-protein ligase RNF216-like [Branchiostoma floridae]|uniref:E3 ubiquitin-protein ligase RNF216-like n=1 Tax=Branchiostoma floridae TaxID=7739 RepID=A0A9J7M4T0_BRAFL|nr:E3 ubiquitin-protein ligase RNF216-like [Branchiostoma floridae]
MAEEMWPCAGPSVCRPNFANSMDNRGPSVSSPARAGPSLSEAGPSLTEDEQWVVMQLSQVFPHLSHRVLRAAVTADDQAELLAKHILLNRCIDSLLEKQGSPISISDGEDEDVPTGDSTLEDLAEDIVDLTTNPGVEVGNQENPIIDADAQVNRGGARKKKVLHPAPVLINSSSSSDEYDDLDDLDDIDEEDEPVVPPAPVPVVQQPPTLEEQQAGTVAQVVEMFPDVEAGYARDLVNRFWNVAHPLNGCCEYLLEHPDYPKAPVQQPAAAAAASKAQEKTNKDFFKDYSTPVSQVYRMQVATTLHNEYRRISVKDIRTILCFYKFHYAPAKKFIQENILAKLPDAVVASPQPRVNRRKSNEVPSSQCEVQVKLEDGNDALHKRSFSVRLLKLPRVKTTMAVHGELCKELKEEMDFVTERTRQQKEEADHLLALRLNEEQYEAAGQMSYAEADHLLALRLNEEQYEAAGQMIECGCCFGEVTFEDMVQCYEGHLFCADCLKNYTKEKVFGAGQASLSCMTDGCDSTFPMGQLEKALPENMLKKYQERLEEENINLAGLDDLVRCPSCDYAAILAAEDKVFRCQNPECMKQTCRHCKEDWAEHFGIPCQDLEKADDTKFRTSIEEKMTEAKIRTCHQCKASFTKHDGCNKMTCRCGAKMCYVCRKPIKDYNHFCRHARNPGEPCTVCTACSLWTSTEEDDERATEEIQKAAREQKKAEGKDRVADKLGPPPEPKRPRIEVVPPPGAGPVRAGPPQGVGFNPRVVVGQNQPPMPGVPMPPPPHLPGNHHPFVHQQPPHMGPAHLPPPPHFGALPQPHMPVNHPVPPHQPHVHNNAAAHAHAQQMYRIQQRREEMEERIRRDREQNRQLIRQQIGNIQHDLENFQHRMHEFHQNVNRQQVMAPMAGPPQHHGPVEFL